MFFPSPSLKAAYKNGPIAWSGLFFSLFLFISATSVQAQQIQLNGQPNRNWDNPDDIGVSGTHSGGATLDAFPDVVKRVFCVRVSGIADGPYLMGLRRQDGTLIQSWVGLVTADSHLTIDIEKVETGILTFFIETPEGELSDSIVHI